MPGKPSPRKLTPHQRKLWEILLFLTRLLVLVIPLYLIIMFQVSLYPLQLAVAGNTFHILNAMGIQTTQDGANLAAGSFKFFISEDSTGWKSMLLFAALVIAPLGIPWRKRLFGMLIGIPVIYLGNLARVLAIVFAERSYGLETAMLTHDYLWRFGLTLLVLALWLLWLWRVGKIDL